MNWTPGSLLKFETERLVLHTMAREDVTDDFRSWMADPEVMVGLNLPRQRLTRSQAVRWVLNHDNRKSHIIIVVDKASDTAIGFFTITIDASHMTAETAVVIGKRDFWGKNVVIEARTALMTFLFETVGVHKVMGRPHGRNFSSIFNYKAMGFSCEAVLREQMRAIDGKGRLDQLVFGLLKSEWDAARSDDAKEGAV